MILIFSLITLLKMKDKWKLQMKKNRNFQHVIECIIPFSQKFMILLDKSHKQKVFI